MADKKDNIAYWRRYHEREEKAHAEVEEMIRKKDEKSLGNWLRDFGKSSKSFWFSEDKKMAREGYSREKYLRDYGELKKDKF